MVSAESDPQLILKILETGIDHYITKPFSEKELQERIDMALKKSHCSIIHR
jgi:DNA-binding response OmpR family regulator